MSTTVHEFFGYRSTDGSPSAVQAAQSERCPFLGDRCVKKFNNGVITGVCTLKPATSDPVICCPNRLYADRYKVLTEVADRAFIPSLPLHPGGAARREARRSGAPAVAVFGKRWGGELRLPQRQGTGGYFVDWVLVLLNGNGDIQEFVAVEVQSIDTTGNYRAGRDALLTPSRSIVPTTAGLNWENVSKRILPQLLYKGHVLQREALCKKGLFFVTPEPVLQRIMHRLGGQSGLMNYPMQSSSLTFLSYDFAAAAGGSATAGQTPLAVKQVMTTNITQVANAFSMPQNLPAQNSYLAAIEAAL